MASPPPASSSFEASILSEALDDIILCARPKHRKLRLLQVARTCYTGSEQKQDIAKDDGKQDSPSHEFVLDSRATSHVIRDASLFSPSFRSRTPTSPADNTAAYQAPDGRDLTVAAVSTVTCDNFRIPNMWCVPDLYIAGLNLVSVQQLAECGYLVMFGGRQCSVMEQSSGKIVGKGRLHAEDGLYHLEFLHLPHESL